MPSIPIMYRFLKRCVPAFVKDEIKYRLGRPSPLFVLQKRYAKAGVADESYPADFPDPFATTSMSCKKNFFELPLFGYWFSRIRNYWERSDVDPSRHFLYHRKLWEFVYIAQALRERGMLAPGKRGLGFAVGTEPLPALFATFGCTILASDQDPETMTVDWAASGEHAGNDLAMLNRDGICPAESFAQRVSYRNVDMNSLPDDLTEFDFCWSSCSFEHLGSIRAGLAFVRGAMETLKPGGIAVHTTELNLSSDDETIDDRPDCVLFRKRDLRRLAEELSAEGHFVWPLDFSTGQTAIDRFVDLEPFGRKKIFLKFRLGDFTTTSFGLIVRKA